MINFWHKHLLDSHGDRGSAIIKLPAAAKIQLCEHGVYPWAKECKDQIEEMGPRALGHPDWYKVEAAVLWKKVNTNERILEAVTELRELVAHNVPPIAFEARRQPLRRARLLAAARQLHDHSMDD